MKAITIWQPWASLLATRGKIYETRPWKTSYRGPIAIHAAKIGVRRVLKKCFPHGEWNYHPDYQAKEQFLAAVADALGLCLFRRDIMEYLDNLPTGKVIATANLVNCHSILPDPNASVDPLPVLVLSKQVVLQPDQRELMLGNWIPGRYAWELSDVKMIDPVPAKGQQGLWNWGR